MPVPLSRGEGISGFRDLPVRERQRGASWEGALCLIQGWGSVVISRLLRQGWGMSEGVLYSRFAGGLESP